MRNILLIVALVLIIGWFLGQFVFSAGQAIHILLVSAILFIIMGVVRNEV